MKPTTALPFVLLSLAGCNKPDCYPSASVYALDAKLPLGFTGQEAIDTLLGEKAITVHWEDGSSEPAMLSVDPKSKPLLYSSWSEIAGDCPSEWDTGRWAEDYEYVPGEAVIMLGKLQIVTTESTALNESFEVPFSLANLEEATVYKRWLSAEFQGSYESPTCDECGSVYLEVSGSLGPSSSSGTLSIYGTVLHQMPFVTDTAMAPEPETMPLATITWE